MTHAMALILMAIGVAVVAAGIVAVATTCLCVLGGVALPNAIVRGGVAFGGTLTIELIGLGLLLTSVTAR